MRGYKNYLPLIPILALAIILRLYHFDQTYGLYGDQGQDLLAVNNWIKFGQIPLVGILTSIGTFHMSPLYYYLITPLVYLLHGNSITPVLLFLVAGIMLVITSFVLTLKFVDLPTATILSFLIAFSPHAIFVGKGAYTPNLQIFLSLMLILLLYRYLKTYLNKYIFFIFFLIGLGSQAHYLFLINLLIVPIIVLLLQRKLINVRFIFTSSSGFFVALIPFFFSQIFLNFADIKAIIFYIFNPNNSPIGISLKIIFLKLMFPFSIYFPDPNLVPVFLAMLITLIYVAYSKNRLSDFTKVVLIYFILGVIFSVLGKLQFWWWYHDYFSISCMILISIFISYLYQYSRIKFIWFIPLIFFSWWQLSALPGLYTIGRSPLMPEKVGEMIASDVQKSYLNKQQIGIMLLPLISDGQGFEYRYFIERAGIRSFKSDDINKVNYLIIEQNNDKRVNANILSNLKLLGEVHFNGYGNTVTGASVYKVTQVTQ